MSDKLQATRPVKGSERATEGGGDRDAHAGCDGQKDLLFLTPFEGSARPVGGSRAPRRRSSRPLRGFRPVPFRVPTFCSPGRRRVECRAATAARADPRREVWVEGMGSSANSSSGSTGWQDRGEHLRPAHRRVYEARKAEGHLHPGSWSETTAASQTWDGPSTRSRRDAARYTLAAGTSRSPGRCGWGGRRTPSTLGGWQKSAAPSGFPFVAHRGGRLVRRGRARPANNCRT